MQLNKGIPLLIIAWLTPKGYWKLEGNNQVDVQIGGKDVKINQSTFYALKILYRLDEVKDRVVTSMEIAEKENYSAGMILKLLRKMGQDGIV